MEQLTTLDAGFLQAEDSDRHASLAIGALVVLEGATAMRLAPTRTTPLVKYGRRSLCMIRS